MSTTWVTWVTWVLPFLVFVVFAAGWHAVLTSLFLP